MVICKSCGFVMDASKLHDRCPACGVLAKMFVPFTDPVSAKRRFILSLDLHPITVHFPVAFSGFLLLLSIIIFFVPDVVRLHITSAISLLGLTLPFTVILAFIMGLIDAKIRFRRLNTPLLFKKMIAGTLLFLFSLAIFIVILLSPGLPLQSVGFICVLSAACIFCASLLGIWGTSLLNARFPG